MERLFFGISFVALGLFFCYYLRKRILNNTLEIATTETSDISDIRARLEKMQKSGDDNARIYTEFKGVADTSEDIKATFSNRRVAYHHSILKQVFDGAEVIDIEKKNHMYLKNSEHIVFDKKSTADIALCNQKSTECVIVDAVENSDVLDGIKTLDKYEDLKSIKEYAFFNQLSIPEQSDKGKLIGYRLIEYTVPIGYPLYLIGDAKLMGGQIYITSPLDKQKPFYISTKTEEQLVGNRVIDATMIQINGYVLMVLGLTFIIMGIINIVS